MWPGGMQPKFKCVCMPSFIPRVCMGRGVTTWVHGQRCDHMDAWASLSIVSLRECKIFLVPSQSRCNMVFMHISSLSLFLKKKLKKN